MTFELEADGVRLWCSSPFWTRKLVEKGARLVDASQYQYLHQAGGSEQAAPGGDDARQPSQR
jgi:hypothetical protein